MNKSELISYITQLEKYKRIKQEILQIDYEDASLHSSYRKLRHHLDRIIDKIEKAINNA